MTVQRLLPRLAAGVAVALMLTPRPGALAHPDHDAASQDRGIHVDKAWVRQTPPGADVGAGYMILWNRTDRADALIAAASPAAERVELHRTVREGDRARMEPQERVALPSREAVMFEPGGHHLMFRGLKAAFTPGETVEVTLTFENGGQQTVTFPVKPIGYSPTGKAGGDHSHHH